MGCLDLKTTIGLGNFVALNQVHVENRSSAPHPQPLSRRARGAGKPFNVPLTALREAQALGERSRVRETSESRLGEAVGLIKE